MKQKTVVFIGSNTPLRVAKRILADQGYDCQRTNGRVLGVMQIVNKKAALAVLEHRMIHDFDDLIDLIVFVKGKTKKYQKIPILIITEKAWDESQKVLLRDHQVRWLDVPFSSVELRSLAKELTATHWQKIWQKIWNR
jgi:response regulator RpfG family c-di-GMP phosphodiesterase